MPPWKFFFPQGHNFAAPDLLARAVDTINLQSNYSDKSYLREVLSWESFRDRIALAQFAAIYVQIRMRMIVICNTIPYADHVDIAT